MNFALHEVRTDNPSGDRDAVRAAPERGHGAALPERVRAAGGDDPLGAVDGRAREHGDAGTVQEISRCKRAGERDGSGTRTADPLNRLLPPESEIADRDGAETCRRTR